MDLKQANAQRWQNMHIPSDRAGQFARAEARVRAGRSRYEIISAKTGIPWEVIGVIHYRESNCDFDTYLGNGQALNRKTTIVPKGRGPFATWEDGAMDALMTAPPKAGLNKDWSIGGTLAKLEEYNGLGYATRGLPSPYIWAGTDQYIKGKYIRDGVFDPNHVDTQLGCAGLLKFLGYKKTSASTNATVIATVAGGAGTAVASQVPSFMTFIENHWVALLVSAIAVGVIIDVGITMYKNRDKNVSNIRDQD